jgi:hypothetical protein
MYETRIAADRVAKPSAMITRDDAAVLRARRQQKEARDRRSDRRLHYGRPLVNAGGGLPVTAMYES